MQLDSNLRRAQRGLTLIEALIAFLILALGMLAMTRLQSDLRKHAELARQRSEGVRLAQRELETLRAYSVLEASAGARSYSEITNATVPAESDTPTSFVVERRVFPAANVAALTVTVHWNDRVGDAHQVSLSSMIARFDPALAAALSTAPVALPVVGAYGRSARIPLIAKDLGDGRSAFKPIATGGVAIVQDNRSGRVVARCSGIAPTRPTTSLGAGDLGVCDAAVGLLLSGSVLFTAAVPQTFDVAVATSGAGYPQPPVCYSAPVEPADATDRRSLYHCVVYPMPRTEGADEKAPTWSGASTLVPIGWRVGTAAGEGRVCRYSSDLDASGAVDDNREQPAIYSAVDAALAQQNFLIVAGDLPCPTAAPRSVLGSAGDVYADLGTIQHQP